MNRWLIRFAISRCDPAELQAAVVAQCSDELLRAELKRRRRRARNLSEWEDHR